MTDTIRKAEQRLLRAARLRADRWRAQDTEGEANANKLVKLIQEELRELVAARIR